MSLIVKHRVENNGLFVNMQRNIYTREQGVINWIVLKWKDRKVFSLSDMSIK